MTRIQREKAVCHFRDVLSSEFEFEGCGKEGSASCGEAQVQKAALWWLVLIVNLTESRIILEVGLLGMPVRDCLGFVHWSGSTASLWMTPFPGWDTRFASGEREPRSKNPYVHPFLFSDCGFSTVLYRSCLDFPTMIDYTLKCELTQTLP